MKTLLGMLAAVNLLIFSAITPVGAASSQNEDRKPNHLLGAESPYLQQHIYNVVDWYPWGEEALKKARDENKPIFISVGYSTCHWCHVMARESFDDEKIGNFLNEHFVSIKIDRERRPDLDEQFMLVTQIIAGNGGWPNSVFLTADANPFYAGTYFPPDVFSNVLEQVQNLWANDNTNIVQEGVRIGDIVRNYMSRTEAARELTPEVVEKAARSLFTHLDEFNGGFGVSPKFPQESALLFLLDQAERTGKREFLDAVTNALDGMIKGGIHDHVGGGFHRYSVDPEWHVPHFEKMLYNQAMIGRLLVRAWKATGYMRYKIVATRVFDYVLADMQDKEGGFYSAEDADSLDKEGKDGEGNFYIWTPEEFDQVLGKDATFALNALSVSPDGNFEGANVLHWQELPAASAKEQGLEEAAYFDRLNKIYQRLYDSRKSRTAPHKDRKILVDWNAMMIVTLAEASRAFSRRDYYESAERAANFILENMLIDGHLKRVSYEGTSGVDAQLSDYAGLGNALIALYDFAPQDKRNDQYLAKASSIADDAMKRYADDAQSAYVMNASHDGLGKFIPYDDTEIPSGNGLMLSLLDKVSKRKKEPRYMQKATLLASALSGHVLEAPISGGYTLLSALALTHGETGSVRYLADGVVRVSTTIDHETRRIKLQINIKDGWHINANVPLEDYFIPTSMKIAGRELGDDQYPEPLVKSLKFNAKPMALYEGSISLEAALPELDKDGQKADVKSVHLNLQACSDEICLLPEEMTVRLW